MTQHSSQATLPYNSYLMYSDAFDTGLMYDASELVTRFKGEYNLDKCSGWWLDHPNPSIPEYDCELLGMSTGADWPPSKEFRRFEKEKYPWSKSVEFVDPKSW